MEKPLPKHTFLYCLFKKKKLYALGGLLFITSAVWAQKQNNVWVFGEYAGLDFNYTPPKALDSMPIGLDTSYFTYVSSICDTSGKLLLYTDGVTVWNQHVKPIERYLRRWPWSTYCMPLFVPHPENDSLFYIFGVSATSYAYRLQYLTVNAKSNLGYGNIIYPQPSTLDNYFTVLKEDASVMVAGTAHCNRRDTWIVTHSQDAFYAYLLTPDGVSATPVVSQIPGNIVPQGKYEQGNIKFSASGEKLIMPLINNNEVAVFEFNNSTGVFSNGFTLHLPNGIALEDAELSPDGSKLYFGGDSTAVIDDVANDFHSIQQWDLDEGSPAQIEQSRYNVTLSPDRVACGQRVCYVINRTLQLGPDGKIYVSRRYLIGVGAKLDKTINVISAPNEKGTAAFYRTNAVNAERMYNYINYNYIRSSSYTVKENGIQFNKNSCSGQPIGFSLIINKIDSVFWNFGDSAAGVNNTSVLPKPFHIYPTPGTYFVKAILYSKCTIDTAYAQVTIGTDHPVQVPLNITDTTLCVGDTWEADATTSNALTYTWNNGYSMPVLTIKQAGTYGISIANACSADERIFTVQYQPCNCNIYLPTAFTPNGDQLNDKFKPVIKCSVINFRFQIFDRFGKIIYTSLKTGEEGWNGKIKDVDASPGIYLWQLTYINPNNHINEENHGTFFLIR